VANDNLTGRRKRGLPAPKAAPEPYVKPGTVAFGERAAERREGIKRRARKGDLRVQTAYKTVKEGRATKNRYLEGD
jgi:hypothetical protein